MTTPDPLPRVSRVNSLLLSKGAPVWRWQAGLRAAAAVGIPGAGMVAAGQAHSALFVTFGAFSVLYGEGRAYRIRAQVVALAGLALLASVAVGSVLGETVPAGGNTFRAATVLMVVVPAVIAVFVVDALRLGPPGALFFALVGSGALIAMESGADSTVLVVATALGALTSIVVSMTGALLDSSRPQREAVQRAVGAVNAYAAPDSPRTAEQRHAAGTALVAAWSTMDDARAADRPADHELIEALRTANRRFASDDADDTDFDPTRDITTSRLRPTITHRLLRSLSPHSHAMITAARVGIACLVAGGASITLGLGRPHWAAISALVILQTGVDRVHGTVRGLHRFLGTAAGLVLFAGLHSLGLTGYALIALIAVLQFSIEMLIVRNYAAAVVVITPVALMASGAGNVPGSAWPVMRERLVETVVGVIVAVIAMYVVLPRAHRRTFSWTATRVRDAARTLVDGASSTPTGAPSARSAARNLHFELEGAVRAGIDSTHNEPAWTAERWPEHARLVHDGYDLTVAFWSTDRSAPLPDGASWRRRFR